MRIINAKLESACRQRNILMKQLDEMQTSFDSTLALINTGEVALGVRSREVACKKEELKSLESALDLIDKEMKEVRILQYTTSTSHYWCICRQSWLYCWQTRSYKGRRQNDLPSKRPRLSNRLLYR